jgi:TetR/AcrR family transcriptional repressor of lmrAB and yxaGH operons
MGSSREQLIETTCELLETQGYHATGLNQIIATSKTPKGSLYYYFPEGKEELGIAAITLAGERIAQNVRKNLGSSDDPAEAFFQCILTIAYHVEASNFQAGGPLTTVALETVSSSVGLNNACRLAYQRIQEVFAEKLGEGGFSQARAAQLATFINATLEGGIMLSRTNHSGEPLKIIAETTKQLLVDTPKE